MLLYTQRYKADLQKFEDDTVQHDHDTEPGALEIPAKDNDE